MEVKYYDSYLSIATSPSQTYKDDLQALVNSQFDNGSDYYTIEEELSKGTLNFSNVDIRINHIVKSNTGTQIGDDFKTIIFQDMNHIKGLGYRYKFDNNIWLTVNSDYYKYVTASVVIKRCNNTLKWYDEYNNLQIEPCCVDYKLNETEFDFNANIIIPEGNVTILCQENEHTKKININDRFVLGNKQVFKVEAINNFLFNQTYDNNSNPLLRLYLKKDGIAEDDDFDYNIANVNKNQFLLTINQDSFEQSVGYSTTLTANVKQNGEIVNQPITWVSSTPSVATIDSNGILSLLSVGTTSITASMTNNLNIIDSIVVNVTNPITPSKVNMITPNVTEIKQNQTQNYSVFAFLNNIVQADTFTITATGDSTKYILNTNSNGFSVKSLGYSPTPLVVTCSNNIDATQVQISIQLKGYW